VLKKKEKEHQIFKYNLSFKTTVHL